MLQNLLREINFWDTYTRDLPKNAVENLTGRPKQKIGE